MPKVGMKDRAGGHMLMSDIKMSADQKRLFADEPLLFGGTQRFEIAQMQITVPNREEEGTTGTNQSDKTPSQPVVLKNVTYIVDAPFDGAEFMDVSGSMGAASLVIGQQEYGPAHYDVSMKHLHARTVAKLYRAVLQMYANPSALKQDPSAAMTAMVESGKALLLHGPELSIDRISFTSPQALAGGGAAGVPPEVPAPPTPRWGQASLMRVLAS
jgi:uncharacterized protein YdgA (DUF945 family)